MVFLQETLMSCQSWIYGWVRSRFCVPINFPYLFQKLQKSKLPELRTQIDVEKKFNHNFRKIYFRITGRRSKIQCCNKKIQNFYRAEIFVTTLRELSWIFCKKIFTFFKEKLPYSKNLDAIFLERSKLLELLEQFDPPKWFFQTTSII